MSAIESAFVTAVVDREISAWESSTGANTTNTTSTRHTNPIPACAQQDTTEKRIFGLRMWSSRNADQVKSEYALGNPCMMNQVSDC